MITPFAAAPLRATREDLVQLRSDCVNASVALERLGSQHLREDLVELERVANRCLKQT